MKRKPGTHHDARLGELGRKPSTRERYLQEPLTASHGASPARRTVFVPLVKRTTA